MVKLIKKTIKITTLFAMMILLFTGVVHAAGSIRRSSSATLYPGDTFTIIVDSGQSKRAYYNIRMAISDTSVISGVTSYTSSADDPARMTFTYTAKKVGTATITLTDLASEADDGTLLNMNGNKVTVTVSPKPSTNPGGGSGSGGGSGTADPGNNIYNPELPKAETPEEKAARELEAKMKIPVVSSIEIFSEATRLKGKLVGSVETKENTFEYGLVLPRGVNAFKLIMNPTNDDVDMDYTQMYKLDNGHDKVEVRVKASEGEVEQTYIINVTMADESDVSYQVGDESYTFLNDALLDALFKPYGFEVTYFEDEDALDYYYQYGENKLVLVSNDAGEAKWLLIDEDKTVLHEVILVSDDDHVVMVVDQELDLEEGVLSPTYGGNPYTLLDMPSLDVFTEFGMDLNFKTQAHGWVNDEESLFTHVIDENGEVRLAHINMNGEGEIAYVAFDVQKVSNEILIYQVVSGVLGALVLTMVFVYRRKAKQFNELFRRRSDMNS